MNHTKPNLYEYHDPIQFLKDWIGYLKYEKKSFNLKSLATKSGVSIANLSMILNRQRPLTEKTFFKICDLIKIDAESKKFLNHLRIIDQSDIQEQRLDSLRQILKISHAKNINVKNLRTFEYLTKWHIVAIYEFVASPRFQPIPEVIQSQLLKKVSIAEIEQSLKFLQEFNFVQISEDGTWLQKKGDLNCTEGIFKLSLGEFHRQMLELAKTSIDNVGRDDRLIMGQTMAVSKEDFEIIKKIIQKSIMEINEVNKNQSAKDNIYHIEVAAFPLLIADSKKTTGDRQ